MLRHGTYAPVVEHEVNVAVADPRGIELDQNIIGT